MGAPEGLIAQIDQIITFFNTRRMDLPDGFFDKRAQFLINDAPFETLLGQPPDDPLVLMLTRGPAGFRFTSKTLQHALPDVKLERGDIESRAAAVDLKLWLSGTLRGSGEALNTVVDVTLRLTASGSVEVAEAAIDQQNLEKIRKARVMA